MTIWVSAWGGFASLAGALPTPAFPRRPGTRGPLCLLAATAARREGTIGLTIAISRQNKSALSRYLGLSQSQSQSQAVGDVDSLKASRVSTIERTRMLVSKLLPANPTTVAVEIFIMSASATNIMDSKSFPRSQALPRTQLQTVCAAIVCRSLLLLNIL